VVIPGHFALMHLIPYVLNARLQPAPQERDPLSAPMILNTILVPVATTRDFAHLR
jgi:hypothetical protein